MRSISAVLAALGLLAAAGMAFGLDADTTAVVVPSGFRSAFGHGHGHGQASGLDCPYVGYGKNLSAYAAGACAVPPYGMEDTGRRCNHWRSSCCDNVWDGYCNETGLWGYRTYRDKGCCGMAGGCGRCGGHLFSLFRWNQPAGDCGSDCVTDGSESIPVESSPAPAPAPVPAPAKAPEA